ncbi:U3 small nucleolar RNA-associated protein 14 homolog A [Anopheles ziemanni]|uniref:U3 small nucleolar RNA-associated protein 14 homolog A n=1 Tax=Anopheles coustani TaxID=139045 RepID=UPI00265A035F|nr:U3 small nucleolar RNA-associated protein 14 homolog A [Anopheles coustani]XP_058169289.1 U3 small nucleolar RNA-associated protein 14 homolog A [Anopheles ziemanni]
MPVEMEHSFGASEADTTVEDEENYVDPKAHAKLLDGINNLTGSYYIREVTRTEPSLKRSEFGLAKAKKDKVQLKDLSKFFSKTPKQNKVLKQLDRLKHRHGLAKPLEKPVADRLKRKAGFLRAQRKLDKWEPVVRAAEVAPQVVFPLQYDKVTVHKQPPKKLSEYRVKSKLMEEMESLEKEYVRDGEAELLDGEGQKEYDLTVEEMRQQLIQRAHQKRLESYQIAKGRRQNKIKSKKYHRLLKKDKLKEQMKKFEELKEKDPAAALRQLDQIEKQRFEERATLRHKNTGTWAKNLQVRAKYNTEVRQELAEQLAIGRELTSQRFQKDESSSESDGEETIAYGDNPWTEQNIGSHERAAAERAKLTSSYRKYWEERNQVEALKKQLVAKEKASIGGETNGDVPPDTDHPAYDDEAKDDGDSNQMKSTKLTKKVRKKVKQTVVRMASGSWDVVDDEDTKAEEPKPEANKKSKTKAKKNLKKESATVEELFQEAEELIQDALGDKLVGVKQKLNGVGHMEANKGVNGTSRKKESKAKRRSDPNDLSFKKKPRLGDADQELNETMGGAATDDSLLPKFVPTLSDVKVTSGGSEPNTDINLKQVVQMKPKHLLTALPDSIAAGELSDGEPEHDDDDDDDDDDHRRLTIAEAFEDDDIVADFLKEKQDDRASHLPKEVDFGLPGWGSWVGPGMDSEAPRYKARQVVNPPKELPRRDDNRDQVIINEDALVNPQLSKHLVNEVPFPYVTVKDYEASLRAPLGRTFVPETAHVTMIEPRVVTKQGAVIEPMQRDMLVTNPAVVRKSAPPKAGKGALTKYNEFVENIAQKKTNPKKKFKK